MSYDPQPGMRVVCVRDDWEFTAATLPVRGKVYTIKTVGTGDFQSRVRLSRTISRLPRMPRRQWWSARISCKVLQTP